MNNKGDTLERAIKAASENIKAPNYENLTGAQVFKHLACPDCHYHRYETCVVNGKNRLRCKKCGGVFERFTIQKVTGARVSESRARTIKILFDDDFDPSFLKKCPQHVQTWFRYAHRGEYGGDRDIFKRVSETLGTALFKELCAEFQPAKNENAVIFGWRLGRLSDQVVVTGRPNIEPVKKAKMAALMHLDDAVFAPGRRWAKVFEAAFDALGVWDDCIIEAFERNYGLAHAQ